MPTRTNTGRVDRRKFVQALSGIAAVGLAGCGERSDGGGDGGGGGGGGGGDGGGGDGGMELGERVPPAVFLYFTGVSSYLNMFEKTAPIIEESLGAAGIPNKTEKREILKFLDEIFSDSRTHHFSYMTNGQSPDRLDPQLMIRRFGADLAGANGDDNLANYASCEYTVPAVQQESAETLEERRELVTQASSVMSEDMVFLPFSSVPTLGVVRSDLVEPSRVGRHGYDQPNVNLQMYTQPREADTLTVTHGQH